jgi:hypothetical protein
MLSVAAGSSESVKQLNTERQEQALQEFLQQQHA